ncbi:MAG TPA: hypothetical protein VFW47_01105 [Phenylobacterium sp.]|nr:hypothetical protein [Phenylobacterium sp.]
MKEVAQLLLLVALAGAAVTFAGSAAIWYFDETRRIRRALRRVLGGEPEIMLVAQGRGRGTGMNFALGLCAVAWDAGGWCLVYRIDELMGAELIIDGQVVGRAFRGEPRRALEQLVTHASRVTLRLVFDDPHHPDFDLDLWQAGDERRRRGGSPADAVHEANRWLARADAILRRPQAPRFAQPAAVVEPPGRSQAPPPWEDPEAFKDDDDIT